MNRFTRAERLALIVLMALVLLVGLVRWWKIRATGQSNRAALPPVLLESGTNPAPSP